MIGESYHPSNSFLRVATACPEVAIGNPAENAMRIGQLYQQAVSEQAAVVVFPELALSGYTIGDMVQRQDVLQASLQGLHKLAERTAGQPTAMVVGLPLEVQNALYNCAAVVSQGIIQGIVPKTHLPTYKEFYEKRWFQSWPGRENSNITIGGQDVPFGTDMLFQVGQAKLGVEICEDLWVADSPSTRLAAAGATLIANPSASPEQVGKAGYRRQLIGLHSARLLLAYLYAGCDASESVTDIVMGGHQLIAENGVLLAERRPLAGKQRLTVADIDIDHLSHDRRRDTNHANSTLPVIDCGITAQQTDLRRHYDQSPFIPKGPEAAAELQYILDMQAQALASYLQTTGVKRVVLGLSGGLDSTLALAVAVQAAERLGTPLSQLVETITMPGEASSDHTQSNAVKLTAALGITNQVIPIKELCQQQLAALQHDGRTQDVAYENVQARTRTGLLFNRANQRGGLVLGTGDLSELALGWCTYNGDHMSHFNVNGGVPKTLVRHLVKHSAGLPAFAEARAILQAILDTPISPELTGNGADGISQETEALIGPYDLHDFFLYHFVRYDESLPKLNRLATEAFAERYTPAEVQKWLTVFVSRFTTNQWKRNVAAPAVKIGSVSLSPRGDWRWPSEGPAW